MNTHLPSVTTTQQPYLFEPDRTDIPGSTPVVEPALHAQALKIMGRYGVLPRAQEDALKIISHILEEWDDGYPDDVDPHLDTPEIHIWMVMPPYESLRDLTDDERHDAYDKHWECTTSPLYPGAKIPMTLTYGYSFSHPLWEANGLLTVRLLPDYSAWVVTALTEDAHE